jgi:hypothetical protein
MGSKWEHEKLIRETLIHLGREAHQLGRFFNNPTGVAWRDEGGKRIWVHYGILGSGDICGFLLGGKVIYLEGKTGKAVQQPNQMRFEKVVKQFGGIYSTFHSKEEALQIVINSVA